MESSSMRSIPIGYVVVYDMQKKTKQGTLMRIFLSLPLRSSVLSVLLKASSAQSGR